MSKVEMEMEGITRTIDLCFQVGKDGEVVSTTQLSKTPEENREK